MTIDLLPGKRDAVLDAAVRQGVASVRVFGSVAGGEEAPESDIDLLVTTGPKVSTWFPAGLMLDLEELLGRHIAFLASRLHQEAVLRSLHTQTGTTQRLSPGLKASCADMEWKKLGALRNVLVHDYLGVDVELV